MADLFSSYILKDLTLRNRVAMSPMTINQLTDGLINDFHVMLLGSRAADGFGLVLPKQSALAKDGRTSAGCGGICDGARIEDPSCVTSIVKDVGIKDMGAVSAIQFGHTGRKGSELKTRQGQAQLGGTIR